MFTQHAAEAENADNAAEQKRQMNKRVRYGEIVQVLSNKWKHEENTIQVVHVSFTPKKLTYITCTCRTCKCVLYKSMYLLHVNDLVHITIFFTWLMSLWYASELQAFLPKLENKIIRKTDTGGVNIDIFTQTNVLRVRITRIAYYSLVYLILF